MDTNIDQFITKLKRRQIKGSFEVARHTFKLLRELVGQSKARDKASLVQYIRAVGERLTNACPAEIALYNMVKRCVHIIHDEDLAQRSAEPVSAQQTHRSIRSPLQPLGSSAVQAAQAKKRGAEEIMMMSRGVSLLNLLEAQEPQPMQDEGLAILQLKKHVMEVLKDHIDEFATTYKSIADQAPEHIHANEIIMTFGKSKSVEEFLRTASKTRKFAVIVVETAPELEGQQMAQILAELKISTTLISDTAAFAMMSRVNKIIVGAHAVLANGGYLSAAGANSFALAARAHGVPLVVLTPTYKLSPIYPQDPQYEAFNLLDNPQKVLSFHSALVDKVTVLAPMYDYVPPELVSFYIMDTGASHHPTYINRMLSEYYTQLEDDIIRQ
eukprot:TRINITY_DN15922_c0_g1_i1.p1 TRINITY_DN15922_c0_g1~~TRINITY_DN15922_c0_g1_i1.p1  ORF type:complete len:407 (+),score=74.42 TRINITY_DN15922_c0_g1_i1:72-1223(+)